MRSDRRSSHRSHGSAALTATRTGADAAGAARLEIVEIRSFESFYEVEYGLLVGLAYTLTGRRDVAEDLVQEAMLRAYKDWGRISAYERPGAWVRRAVINLAASRWRRQRTAARSMLRLTGRPDTEDPSADAQAVWEAVRSLPRRQAEVIALYYGCDLAVDEIAETLDCAPGTVRTHLVRGREALRGPLAGMVTDGNRSEDER
jgi:RNA polymerase sigma-70 factor, ECF subfamily